jgi:hypothetical protein
MLDSNSIGWHFWPYKKMDNSAAWSVSNNQETYSIISAYADTARESFKDIQQYRPRDMQAVKKALSDFY